MIVLGVVTYLLTGMQQVTALIPAAFGVLFEIMGAIGLAKESLRKHAMHVAAMLSLVGILAVGGRLLPAAVQGKEIAPAAAFGQTIFLLLCLVFLIAAIRSFIAARRARLSNS